jgi:serine/threonine protein kinase
MTDSLYTITAALSERYRIECEIGRGGMATVYLARDAKHDREVAVKVLRPDLTASLGSERFLREIQVAAKLVHPHILTLIDSGEIRGLLFYVMPFVSGGSLRSRIAREGPLDLETTLSVTGDIADALVYAHRLGVVHRDIKPENVLFSEGHALVTDFGIAKAVSSATDEPLTRTGVAIGTPGYMSPEQASGVLEVDERTDVFSLACVTYEMLVGALPARWVSDDEARLGRLDKAPAAHLERLRRFPSSVERALARGMAVDPDARMPTPVALAGALAGTDTPDAKYGNTAVQEIIGRAASLQANETASDGVSLTGVKRIAAEVDIPSRHVEAAARDVATPMSLAPPASVSRVFGVPAGHTFSRVVRGELPESEFAGLLEIIQETLGEVGSLESSMSNVFAWSAGATPGQLRNTRSTRVQVSVRKGRTKIYISDDRSGTVGATIAAGVLGLGAVAAGTLGTGIAVLWIAGGVLVAGGIGSLVELGRRRSDLLNRLLDRLTLHVSSTAPRETD